MRNPRPERSVVQESGPGRATSCTSSRPWDGLGNLNFGRIRIGIELIDEDNESDDQVAQLLKEGHDLHTVHVPQVPRFEEPTLH